MQKLTLFSKLILFFTSYIPLGIICLIIDFNGFEFPFFAHRICSPLLIVLMIILIILLFFLLRHFRVRASGWEKMNIVKVENMDNQLVAYIFTYILPFLGFPAERRIAVALFILFVICILYIRTDMIAINPVLALFGYHIIKVEWKKSGWKEARTVMLISRLDAYSLKYKKTIDAVQIHNELHLLKGNGNDKQ
ncbi:MAG: hypothetical protein JW864_09630 [Spirochaetes bacterium]|nr:hypothetical protein [Spirochaetota bacterium]